MYSLVSRGQKTINNFKHYEIYCWRRDVVFLHIRDERTTCGPSPTTTLIYCLLVYDNLCQKLCLYKVSLPTNECQKISTLHTNKLALSTHRVSTDVIWIIAVPDQIIRSFQKHYALL